MKKFLLMLMIMLGITVYLKQTAYMTYKGWGKFDPPYKIELKDDAVYGSRGVQGVSKDGKKILIPWDSIAYMEED